MILIRKKFSKLQNGPFLWFIGALTWGFDPLRRLFSTQMTWLIRYGEAGMLRGSLCFGASELLGWNMFDLLPLE